MNNEEKIAKTLMEKIYVGAEMQYRLDQSKGEHDFDLRYTDGTTAAVEVTASRDQTMEETMAPILKKDFFIPRKKGTNDWKVYPMAGARINRIWSQVDEYLAAIEVGGLSQFCIYTDADISAVASIYNDLKIEGGKITKWKSSPCVGVEYPDQGNGLILAEDIQQAIEAEANKEDNRRKLGTAGTDERHLFVYVDSYSLAWDALVRGVVPEQPVSLPSEITHVWAVTQTRSVGEFTAWRAKRGQGWQNLCTISVNPSA
jgi:hypothetical protein